MTIGPLDAGKVPVAPELEHRQEADARIDAATQERRQLRIALIKAAISGPSSAARAFDVARAAIETADAVLWLLDWEESCPEEGRELLRSQRHDRFSRKLREAIELGL